MGERSATHPYSREPTDDGLVSRSCRNRVFRTSVRKGRQREIENPTEPKKFVAFDVPDEHSKT
jgi:hypothetical protein